MKLVTALLFVAVLVSGCAPQIVYTYNKDNRYMTVRAPAKYPIEFEENAQITLINTLSPALKYTSIGSWEVTEAEYETDWGIREQIEADFRRASTREYSEYPSIDSLVWGLEIKKIRKAVNAGEPSQIKDDLEKACSDTQADALALLGTYRQTWGKNPAETTDGYGLYRFGKKNYAYVAMQVSVVNCSPLEHLGTAVKIGSRVDLPELVAPENAEELSDETLPIVRPALVEALAKPDDANGAAEPDSGDAEDKKSLAGSLGVLFDAQIVIED
jgi:hypothetical protein